MKIAILFLISFVVTFIVICTGGMVFHYPLNGFAAFLGSAAVGLAAAAIAHHND